MKQNLNHNIKPYVEAIVKEQQRITGVLLHPTSLPSGVLDKDVYRWLDFMAAASLKLWQVLPLGVPQDNLSPYQCYSAFAMNPALLDQSEVENNAEINNADFQQWHQQESHWLDDYALFIALKESFNDAPWYEWNEPFKHREEPALEQFKETHGQQINTIYQQQYQIYQRWHNIRDYAAERNIYLFGDMPIFVAHDSADVWAHQDYFLLDQNGQPEVVAGVPPDYFSATGQRWGNPHFNWQVMQKNNFDWWIDRIKNHLQLFDLVRIDHFRGLEAVWVIEADCETAECGVWQKVLGDQLLQSLKNEMGEIPLVAEDLGIITPEVNALREKYHLPGMSVLQFSFDNFDDNPHKPKNINHQRIAYTGTHDNDTTVGWYQSLDDLAKQHILTQLGIHEKATANQVCDTLMDITLQTKAQLAVIPIQDFLYLGSEARMNIPGTVEGNWQWRFQWQQMPSNLAEKIKHRIARSGRYY